ncbi:MAG: hypothetical protein ACPHEQ_02485 [Arenicellales bacterium]
MTKLITPPAVLRDPHVDNPETRETGDPIFNITLEFASEEDVKPLADEISRLMPENGSSPLRKIQTPAGHVWRIKLRRTDQPKVLGPDLKSSHDDPLRDGDLVRAQMGLMTYTNLGSGVVGYLGDIQFLMHSDFEPTDQVSSAAPGDDQARPN